MSEVNVESKGGKKKGVKKMSTRVDFTPMVDLGFLLITFFMLTTTLLKPQTMEISMPSKDKVADDENIKIKESLAITVLLGKDNVVYYYFGMQKDGVDPQLIKTDFSPKGIRDVLLQRNAEIVLKITELKKEKIDRHLQDSTYKRRAMEIKGLKSSPVVLIKATDDASYNNLVDILDEMQICNIGKYAIVDITEYDLSLIKKLNG